MFSFFSLTLRCFDSQVLFHDVAALTQKLFPIVEAMQKHFSSGSGAYYSDAIFFLSVAMHRIMPEGKQIFTFDLATIVQCSWLCDLFCCAVEILKSKFCWSCFLFVCLFFLIEKVPKGATKASFQAV